MADWVTQAETTVRSVKGSVAMCRTVVRRLCAGLCPASRPAWWAGITDSGDFGLSKRGANHANVWRALTRPEPRL